MMRMPASLVALCLLSACDLFGGGGTSLPPPEHTQRVGADRQAPAASLATSRAKARHDADAAAVDEARSQPVGSIVPAGQPSVKAPPPATPPEPAPVPTAPVPSAPPPS